MVATLTLVALALPLCSSADLKVDAGFDLFTSSSGTMLDGIDFVGVPIGSYNFGGAVGLQNTGNADTIIQRNQTVMVNNVGDSSTTSLTVQALQLKSATEVNFMGDGLDTYYITLRATQPDDSSMTIQFGGDTGGSFTSRLDLNLDIRKGSLTGTVVSSLDNLVLTGGDIWSRTPPPGSVTITGANVNLNGSNNADDFWPNSRDASTPEPITMSLGIAGVALFMRRRRRARRAE
ncbi:MAG TPA: hypothetical protein VMI31_03405 [Fimbriimonadaceae bacterium]|nr:hypothetical protein [Fimbriimonadaceae bacterium]